MVIHREGKPVTQLEQNYQDWVMKMHDAHDEEATSGEDEAILVLESLDKKALGILRDGMYQLFMDDKETLFGKLSPQKLYLLV